MIIVLYKNSQLLGTKFFTTCIMSILNKFKVQFLLIYNEHWISPEYTGSRIYRTTRGKPPTYSKSRARCLTFYEQYLNPRTGKTHPTVDIGCAFKITNVSVQFFKRYGN